MYLNIEMKGVLLVREDAGQQRADEHAEQVEGGGERHLVGVITHQVKLKLHINGTEFIMLYFSFLVGHGADSRALN